MRFRSINLCELSILVILSSAFGASALAAARSPVPDNMGGGLRQLVEEQQTGVAMTSSASASAVLEPRVLRDEQSRVLVNVWLDGKRSLSDVHTSLSALGANVSAELS